MTPVKGAEKQYGWYYGWNIVAVCVLAQIAANALPVNAFSLFLQGWSKQLHTPISTLQLALASCGIGCALISPLIGTLSDKYPARWLFGIGLAGIAVFCFGIGLMRASWQLILLYALVLPFALSLATTVPANAVVSRWFVRRLGLALGLTSFGLSFAGIVMPPIVAVALPAIGWRMIWFVAGTVVALVILPLALLVLRDRPSPRDGLGYLTASGTSRPHHGHGHGGKSTLRWRTIIASRNFWLLVIIYLPMLALYGGLGQNLAPIATSRGLSPQIAGMLLSAFSLAQLLATLGGGLLSDRFGNRLPLAGMALVAAAGGVIVAFGHSLAVIGCGTILTGVGGGFWPLLVAAVAVEFGAEGVGRAFGLIIFFLPIAVLAPFAAAKMQESTGSYVPALLTLAAASVLAGLVCLLLREKRQNLVTTGSEPPVAELAVPTD